MSRSLIALTATMVASAGCADRLPTEPGSSASRAINESAAIVVPPNASSLCLASVAALSDLEAKLLAAPADVELSAARAAQRDIATDVCN